VKPSSRDILDARNHTDQCDDAQSKEKPKPVRLSQ
jgi:hypothetical protein